MRPAPPLVARAKNKTPPVLLQHYGRSLHRCRESMRLSIRDLWGADV